MIKINKLHKNLMDKFEKDLMDKFEKDLVELLNKHEIEDKCHMPNKILANTIVDFIDIIGKVTKRNLD